MEVRTQRKIILAAIIFGAAFSWLIPAAISALWHPLPTLLFATWAGIVGVGGFIIAAGRLGR